MCPSSRLTLASLAHIWVSKQDGNEPQTRMECARVTIVFSLMHKVPIPPTKCRNPKTEHRIEIFYVKLSWLYATNFLHIVICKIAKNNIYNSLEVTRLRYLSLELEFECLCVVEVIRLHISVTRPNINCS